MEMIKLLFFIITVTENTVGNEGRQIDSANMEAGM
jgi:hypothetical protein